MQLALPQVPERKSEQICLQVHWISIPLTHGTWGTDLGGAIFEHDCRFSSTRFAEMDVNGEISWLGVVKIGYGLIEEEV